MTIEDAAKHHPGATPILSTREVRTGNSLRSHSSGPMPGSDAWRRLHGDDFADNVPYGNPPAAMLESKE